MLLSLLLRVVGWRCGVWESIYVEKCAEMRSFERTGKGDLQDPATELTV
jgi:hypothetical protein